MSERDDGGPAFPVADYDHQVFRPKTGYDAKRLLSGMPLRDAMAMSVRMPDDYASSWGAALIGEDQPGSGATILDCIDWWMRVEAAYRYRLADAMLAAREGS